MDLVFFSDLHAHPHQAHATTLAGGVNSRLQGCVDALAEVVKAANAMKDAVVIDAGDLFHAKNTTTVEAWNPIHAVLMDLKHPIYHIPGNHDTLNSNLSRHCLEQLHDPAIKSYVCDEPTVVNVGPDTAIGFVPFPMENAKFSEKKFWDGIAGVRRAFATLPGTTKKILVSHAYTHELMRKYTGQNGDVSAEDLSGFDAVFLGHHHVHDHVTTKTGMQVVSIGATIQHTFTDAGQPRGYVTLETDTMAWTHVPIPGVSFQQGLSKKKLAALPNSEIAGGFFRVEAKDQVEARKVKEDLLTRGAASVDVKITPTTKKARITISANDKDAVILGKYFDAVGPPPGVTKEELIETAADYLPSAVF